MMKKGLEIVIILREYTETTRTHYILHAVGKY